MMFDIYDGAERVDRLPFISEEQCRVWCEQKKYDYIKVK